MTEQPVFPQTIRLGADEEDLGEMSVTKACKLASYIHYEDKVMRFWDDSTQEWKPLRELYRAWAAWQLECIRSTHISHVQFLGGDTEEDCEFCRAMNGKVFPISEAPELPMDQCTCKPWTSAILVSVQPPNQCQDLATES
jgi:hypothetical protein